MSQLLYDIFHGINILCYYYMQNSTKSPKAFKLLVMMEK